MKRTIALSTLVSTLLASCLFAEDLPMLRSKDALRTYALELSANVGASISTSLPSNADTGDYTPVEASTAAGICNTIRGMNLSVDVVNPNDSLFLWAGAYSADGDQLFIGWKQFHLVTEKGGYALPSDYGDITLSLSDTIPITVAGARAANIAILGSAGQTIRSDSLRVENGKVYFPRQLAGTNAVLSVYVENDNDGKGGEWVHWSVNDGSRLTTELFNVRLNTAISGIVSFTDDNVLVSVPTTNSLGQNLTAELKVTASRNVLSSFWTTEGKWFAGAWVRKAGTSQWQYYAATAFKDAGLIGLLISAQPGIYYIVPDWNDGDLIEPADPWYPPYEGGGKG